MDFRVLIVHPSRGRAKEARVAFDNHIKTRKQYPITYVLSIDVDDSQRQDYNSLFLDAGNIAGVSFSIIEDTNRGCVQATNRAYSKETLDRHGLIILTSDDMRLCQDWDVLLKAQIDYHGYDKSFKTSQPGGREDIMTFQIAGNKFFEDYGTFFWPEYISCFADEDMTRWAQKHGRWINAGQLVCPHLHPSIHASCLESFGGALPDDETYRREMSNWDYNRTTFGKRAAQGYEGFVYKEEKHE